MSSLADTGNAPLPPVPRGRMLLLLSVLLVIGGVVGWQVWNRWKASQLVQQAEAALRRDDLAEAKRFLQAALDRRPGQPETVWLQARAARRAGELDQARELLAAAEALGYDTFRIGLERVLILAQEGGFTQEEPQLRGFLTEPHPEAAAVLEVLTVGYFLDYRVVESSMAARRWTEVQPESPRAWKYLAKSYELLRNKPETIRCYRESLQRNPGDYTSRFEMVRLQISERLPREEIEPELTKLIEAQPEDFRLLLLRGQFREGIGQIDEARGLFDEALRRDPNSTEALYYRGRLELDHGSPAKARELLKKLVELAPYEDEYLYTYFRSLSLDGPTEESKKIEARWKQVREDLLQIRELTSLAAREPQNADCRREIGERFLRNAKPTEGLRWLQQSLALDPQSPATHRVLAKYYRQANQPQLADYHAQRAQPLQLIPPPK